MSNLTDIISDILSSTEILTFEEIQKMISAAEKFEYDAELESELEDELEYGEEVDEESKTLNKIIIADEGFKYFVGVDDKDTYKKQLKYISSENIIIFSYMLAKDTTRNLLSVFFHGDYSPGRVGLCLDFKEDSLIIHNLASVAKTLGYKGLEVYSCYVGKSFSKGNFPNKVVYDDYFEYPKSKKHESLSEDSELEIPHEIRGYLTDNFKDFPIFLNGGKNLSSSHISSQEIINLFKLLNRFPFLIDLDTVVLNAISRSLSAQTSYIICDKKILKLSCLKKKEYEDISELTDTKKKLEYIKDFLQQRIDFLGRIFALSVTQINKIKEVFSEKTLIRDFIISIIEVESSKGRYEYVSSALENFSQIDGFNTGISLCLAAIGDHSEVTQMLVNREDVVDIYQTDIDDCTAVDLAIEEESVRSLEILIAAGFDINKEYESGFPIVAAIQKKNLDIIKLLISSGAEINKEYESGLLIFTALQDGDIDVINTIIEAGANIEVKFEGISLLSYVISSKELSSKEIIEEEKFLTTTKIIENSRLIDSQKSSYIKTLLRLILFAEEVTTTLPELDKFKDLITLVLSFRSKSDDDKKDLLIKINSEDFTLKIIKCIRFEAFSDEVIKVLVGEILVDEEEKSKTDEANISVDPYIIGESDIDTSDDDDVDVTPSTSKKKHGPVEKTKRRREEDPNSDCALRPTKTPNAIVSSATTPATKGSGGR